MLNKLSLRYAQKCAPFLSIISFVDVISMISRVKWRVDRISGEKKSEMKWNGERFFRAVKGFIIFDISLEMGELYCVYRHKRVGNYLTAL